MRKDYSLEYRYSDGNDAAYPAKELSRTEQEVISKLLELLGLPEEDHPTEIAIVFNS